MLEDVTCSKCGVECRDWPEGTPCPNPKCGHTGRNGSISIEPMLLISTSADRWRFAKEAFENLINAALMVKDMQRPTAPESDKVLVDKAYVARLHNLAWRAKKRFEELKG